MNRFKNINEESPKLKMLDTNLFQILFKNNYICLIKKTDGGIWNCKIQIHESDISSRTIENFVKNFCNDFDNVSYEKGFLKELNDPQLQYVLESVQRF